ncbi:MAG: TatD family hydrolase [Lentisphaeria bacterium]|nr:TatD family hydrolase [Lentisphaeria bacterium]
MTVCDFHTHHINSRPAILSATSPEAGKYTSLEYHPWHLPEAVSALPETFAKLNSFIALGEIGLDRLRGPAIEIQQQYLKTLLQLASDCNKPVIFHCVRAFPELFALLKNFSLPWAIHGFRGKAELLEAIWQRGGIVSLHCSVTNNLPLLKKLASLQGKIAFETDDDAELDLETVVDCAMSRSGNTDLLKIANDTFMEFVSYGK